MPDRLVTIVADSGPGSLRDAVGYGGNIRFHSSLDNQTINLTSGPIMIYLYDVNIDASALPHGISVVNSGGVSFWKDEWNVNTVKLNNVKSGAVR